MGNLNTTKRTILYYPSIILPSDTWLRQALLYWDEVGSIVPYTFYKDCFPPEMQFLSREGIYRMFRPHDLFKNHKLFFVEFCSEIQSKRYKQMLGPKNGWKQYRIYFDKLDLDVLWLLEKEGLILGRTDNCFLVEEQTALLYMSLLAQHLADTDLQSTVIGTNLRDYENIIFNHSRSQGVPCLNNRFFNILPIPREDVPLGDILAFRQKHKNELLHFVTVLESFQQQASLSEDINEFKDKVTKFGRTMELALSNLSARLKDAKIATLAGCLKTIINVKSPTLLASAGSVIGHTTKIIQVPVECLAVLGAIEISTYWIEKRNEKRAALRNSPFAYLYNARAEGII